MGALPKNSISGVVRGIEYQGSYVKVTLDIGNADPFVANVSDAAFFADPLKIGDRAVATWHLEDVHTLATVDTGTAAESFDQPAPRGGRVGQRLERREGLGRHDE